LFFDSSRGPSISVFLNSNPGKRAQVFEQKLRTRIAGVTRTCTEATPACRLPDRTSICGAAISAPPRFVFRTSFDKQYRRDVETDAAAFKPVRRNGATVTG
jgi:hypothetical protein